MKTHFGLATIFLGFTNCTVQPKPTAWDWQLPDHIPIPNVPPDNPLTIEKAELGRILFYDFQLSNNGRRSCGVCHEQAKGFTDGFARSVGEDGDVLPHNSLSIANVAWRKPLMWLQPDLIKIEAQVKIPLFQTAPIEMGMHPDLLLNRLKSIPYYSEPFDKAFPDNTDPFTIENIGFALASHQRRIVSVQAPYDLFISGDDDLSQQEKRGMERFMSDELQCFRCHGGPFFDQPLAINGTLEAEPGYFNTGLYNVDGEGGYPSSAQGLYALTGDPSNMGQFRTPSLRNVSVTGPWGHDGSFASLENVIQAYARGGRLVQSGANAGDGALNQWKDARIQGFEISPSEVSDLIAFLHTLTDEAMLDKPEYADPFCRDAETDQIDCIRPFIMD